MDVLERSQSANPNCLIDENPPSYDFPWLAALFAIVLIAFGMLLRLDALPFYEPDEARYAEVAREMIETGNYLIPQFNYEVRIQKPVLYHWFVAASFKALGVNAFAARLPSVLCALGMLLLTGYFAHRRWGGDAAVLSIGILGSSALFWWVGRMALLDIFLCLAMTASLMLLFEWERRREEIHLLWFAAFTIAVGVNFKGPVAIALPVFIFCLYAAARGELVRLWRAAPWIKILLVAVAFSLPWFLAVVWVLGGRAAEYFFVKELFGRYFTNEFGRGKPVYYYAPVALIAFLPWTFLLIRSFWKDGFEMKAQGLRQWAKAHSERAFLLAWFFGVLIFFTFCKSKLAHYIMPAAPPAALLAAHGWLKRGKGNLRIASWAIPVVLLIASAYACLRFNSPHSALPLLIFFGALLLLYAIYLSLSRYSGRILQLAALILTPILFYQCIIIAMNRDGEIWPSWNKYAQFAARWTTPGAEFHYLREIKPSLPFQLKKKISEITAPTDQEELRQAERLLQSSHPILLGGESRFFDEIGFNMKEEETKLGCSCIPFGKMTLIYNAAYAEANFKALEISLEPRGTARLAAIWGGSGGCKDYRRASLLSSLSPPPDAVLLLRDADSLHPTRKYDWMDAVFAIPFKDIIARRIPFYAAPGDSNDLFDEGRFQLNEREPSKRYYYTERLGNDLVELFFLNQSSLSETFALDWKRSDCLWKIAATHSSSGKPIPPRSFSPYEILSSHTDSIFDQAAPSGSKISNGSQSDSNDNMAFLVIDVFPEEMRLTAVPFSREIVYRDMIPQNALGQTEKDPSLLPDERENRPKQP